MLSFQYDHSCDKQDELSFDNQQLILQALSNIPLSINNKEKVLQQENTKLKKKVNVLENKNQELINEIQDLRQLIKRVYSEGEVQMKHLRQKNSTLSSQNDSLTKALTNLQNNIETFGQLKELSKLFEENDQNP